MAKDDLLHKGAILQRDEETYAIVVRLPGSMIDIATGRKIADVARKFGAKTLKVTGDGRLANLLRFSQIIHSWPLSIRLVLISLYFLCALPQRSSLR